MDSKMIKFMFIDLQFAKLGQGIQIMNMNLKKSPGNIHYLAELRRYQSDLKKLEPIMMSLHSEIMEGIEQEYDIEFESFK